jgi:hypothetical protein
MIRVMGASMLAALLALAVNGAGASGTAPGAAPAGAAAAAGGAPIARLNEAQLDRRITAAQALPIGDRIQELSRLFVGTTYVDFPLGEGGTGPEPQARFRLDGVDCQTYVETVLAMANARSLSQAKVLLDDIRYASLPPSFATRNHFTEAQWLPKNIEKGYLRSAVESIDARAPVSELVLEKASWTQVPFLQRLASAAIPEGRFGVRYLPLAEARARAGSIAPGSVILVVREADPKRVVRVSHMGIVVRSGAGLAVRHASSVPAERRVVEEPFDRYLDRMGEFKKWKVIGFGLALPLDAKARAAAILGGPKVKG